MSAVQCLYRVCIFKGKLLSITSSLHLFLYSSLYLNHPHINHCSSRGREGDKQRGLDLCSSSWFSEVFWPRVWNIPLSHRLFVCIRGRAKICLSTYAIAHKKVENKTEVKNTLFCLWFSQLLARRATKSVHCPTLLNSPYKLQLHCLLHLKHKFAFRRPELVSSSSDSATNPQPKACN